MQNIEVIICTEKGYLESLSKLLIYSLRTFGGDYKDIPIYSYQPRKEFAVSKETILFFEQNQVEYIDLNLNSEFTYYPLANKPLACAHREIHTNAKTLVFLDSDIFLLNAPGEFTNFENADVILRPVDLKNIGSESMQDENSFYWRKLYDLLNVKINRKVTTTIDNVQVLEYYNSGQIIAKASTSLFSAWKENFSTVMEHDLKPNQGLFFVEQSVFSATVSQLELDVKHVNLKYNVPVHLLPKNNQFKDFNNFVTIHYHKLFWNKKEYNYIIEQLENSEKGKLLIPKLTDFGVIVKENQCRRFAKLLIWRIQEIQRMLA